MFFEKINEEVRITTIMESSASLPSSTIDSAATGRPLTAKSISSVEFNLTTSSPSCLSISTSADETLQTAATTNTANGSLSYAFDPLAHAAALSGELF